MFEKISNSFALARSSWHVLKTDKHLVVFPILSGICCVIVLTSFALPLAFMQQPLEQLEKMPTWVAAIVTFLFYFVNYFVITFFNAALMSCALIRFNGGEPTVGDGLRAAGLRLPQILMWALVSATVGMLLKAIENAHEKAGYFISAILGTVWTVLTYFVVPVLVVEKLGPFAAIRRSTAILKQTWGEALVGKFGIGFYILLLALPGILLFVVGIIVFAANPGLTALGVALIIVAVIYFLAVSAIGAALQGIFVSALYQYAAHGEVPTGFEADTMRGAFGHK